MIHLMADEARKQGRKFGLLLIDLEGQYKFTIEHAHIVFDMYADCIEPYWVCLPIHLRNAVSVYEPFWKCWDSEAEEDWIRQPPGRAITDPEYFDFFWDGMEFEEFAPLFGEWYAQGEDCACCVGIRSDESLDRFRTISSTRKTKFQDLQWTTKVTPSVYNVYPVYDWRTSDIWVYHAQNPDKPHNKLYDLMHRAGLTIHQMRICQPYGDDQRRGLWLFHLIEPITWAKVVARVNGANSGAMYVMDSGNINGYNKIEKPPGHTWKSFAKMLIGSMPARSQTHYMNKIILFVRWWKERGYENGIPDEVEPKELETKKLVPSWRRVCKSLLRNDFWCKGLGFSQQKSAAYQKYLDLMERRKKNWRIESNGNIV